MAFDQATRNRLAAFVADSRDRLVRDFTRQLQSDFGMNPENGEIAPLETLGHLDDRRLATARILRDTAAHYLADNEGLAPAAAAKERREALRRIVREQAFTVLNRLCALQMAEARGILVESVGRGYESKGFRLYRSPAGAALGETGTAYREFLFSLFDEFAVDLPVLFDRFAPQGRLFPAEPELRGVLDEINHPEIAPLWAEDETIGWIYQYFNSVEERRRMRAESSAPRDSRELAVRNQFFTPRYVVEFLTDNTLGRIWYEMTGGRTALADRCRYLVRRPGEEIPARAPKDPREIRMIDPACGSMHFGLYSYDLFETIYAEAWDLEERLGETALARPAEMPSLHASFGTKEAFLLEVPRLILENNLHGVDIDPRAVQIAGLSLWLRAQRAWSDRGIPAKDRPRIRRIGVVCAEPMPGEADLLDEFAARLRPKVLGPLLKTVFRKMQLAGEAGTLLRIEEDIRSAVTEAHEAYVEEIRNRKAAEGYLDGMAPENRTESLFDFSDLPKKENFWETAEERLVDALRDFAEEASGDDGRRRLFADDAARGFALIDLLSKRFDVSLQNPPFGDFSSGYKEESRQVYPNTYNDIFAAFIERSLEMLVPDGMLGAITSRTGFFLGSFENWRKNVLLGESRFELMVDLGGAVMDEAMVEAAAYCLRKGSGPCTTTFFRLLGKPDRGGVLARTIAKGNTGEKADFVFETNPAGFLSLPTAPFAYWVASRTLSQFHSFETLQPSAGTVCQGLVTGDNFRFMRTLWEVPEEELNNRWAPYVLAGVSQPWYSPLLVCVDWKRNGRVFHFLRTCRIGNEQHFFHPGLSWTRRAVRFIPYAIPSGCVPSASRYMIYPRTGKETILLGLLGSNVASAVLRCYGERFQHPNFLVDSVKQLPWPGDTLPTDGELERFVGEQVLRRRSVYRGYEPFQEFVRPAVVDPMRDGKESNPLAFDYYHLLPESLDDRIAAAYGLGKDEATALQRDLFEAIGARNGPADDEEREEEDEGNPLGEDVSSEAYTARALVSYAVGCVFGRWDVRFATGEKEAPATVDPFAPLPQMSPGRLSPESFARIAAGSESYPVRLAATGIVEGGEGPDGLARRVQDVFSTLFGDGAQDREQSVLRALGVADFATYFSRPGAFFANHLLTYTKSRRSAPLYWPISTRSGKWTLWVYYHSISGQTLFGCVNEHIDPELARIAEALAAFRTEPFHDTRAAAEAERLENLETELKDLRAELLRVAAFWRPDRNDGVQISAAPLWKLCPFRPWREKLKKTWEALEAGRYDWSGLALAVWPERVVRAAREDRSIAVAHDLEDALWEEVPVVRRGRTSTEWRPKDLAEGQFEAIVESVKERR